MFADFSFKFKTSDASAESVAMFKKTGCFENNRTFGPTSLRHCVLQKKFAKTPKHVNLLFDDHISEAHANTSDQILQLWAEFHLPDYCGYVNGLNVALSGISPPRNPITRQTHCA